MNAKFVAVELDQMPDGPALRAELAKVIAHRTGLEYLYIVPLRNHKALVCTPCSAGCVVQRTNRTSMPNIWIRQKPIGGCNDGPGLLTLDRKGQLRPMLQSAGAL